MAASTKKSGFFKKNTEESEGQQTKTQPARAEERDIAKELNEELGKSKSSKKDSLMGDSLLFEEEIENKKPEQKQSAKTDSKTEKIPTKDNKNSIEVYEANNEFNEDEEDDE